MLTVSFWACNDFLDEQPSKSTRLPITHTEQLDALLANDTDFCEEPNRAAFCGHDDWEFPVELYQGQPMFFPGPDAILQTYLGDYENLAKKNDPFWGGDGYKSGEYSKIFRANVVLQSLDNIEGTGEDKARLKAEAHFIRAYSHWNLVNTYALPYTAANASEPGVPLKKSTSFEEAAARATIEETKNGRTQIIITEIPYMVIKSDLLKTIAEKVRDKVIEGLTDVRDESGRAGMRIVIEYRRDANGHVILNQLYKYTKLQDTCAINMLALVNGEPKVLPLKAILSEYIKFQEEVITRRVKFDLAKALHEEHIFEGYKIAIDNIEEVIKIIRSSADVAESRENLKNRFALSDEQAQAIVSMTLGRLSGMERDKVEARLADLKKQIEEYRAILADENRIKGIIREELLEIKRKFGDERRTELVDSQDEILYEDLIERHNCVITVSHAGYIKRQPASTYSAQRRGGKGIIGAGTKEEDFIENVIVADSHSNLLLFTNFGKVHCRKAYQIPEASRTAKGTNIVNILELDPGEKLTAVIQIDGFGGDRCLTMATLHGVVKRTLLSEFEYQRRGGKIAINLDEGDELIFVACTSGDEDILIATHDGNAARFAMSKINVIGRTGRGVRGIKLREGDFVIGAVIIEPSEEWNATHHIVSVTEGGFGKRVEPSQYEAKGRAIQGVLCHRLSDKTGKLCSVAAATDDDDIMIITNEGTLIRTPVADIPVYSRTAAGVIVMRLAEGASIVNTTITPSEKEEEEEKAESEE